MLPRSVFFSCAFLLASAISAFAETRLVMVEEEGCMWCARWNEDISEIYPKTPEGRTAPLLRMDIHAPRPDDISFERSLHFTPTFVLLVDGQETSRIEGYPGEDFFWGMLQLMLKRANVDLID